MFEYQLHQFRAAELAEEAAHQRLVREARKAGKARRALGRDDAGTRGAAAGTAGTRPGTGRGPADRFTRAA
ncbi:hypothetical protein GCM10018785_68710 [Streptomyces longispororuber]|uniref:Uncharacterized protein n=1 Tax=Streptomyces longispororuber TaxID=68230 RepID=A0A919A8U7_9ACTN|nr:hypothetical protein [Streptomyces longispororuber]GHE92935.1 hypothetical protein GCM10018785_68710 [Streptomyces longispororuber]